MEKKNYESLFVVDVTLGEEGVRALVDKFLSLIAENGEITQTNEWGKRKLAYAINYKTEGYYVLVEFKCAPSFPSELERVFNITEGIMRSLVVAKGE